MNGRTLENSIRSRLAKESFFIDSLTKKSIIYNRVLFKTRRNYYSEHGWRLLSQHYAAFLYSLEKEFRLISISDDKMRELKQYAKRYVYIMTDYVLTKYDIEMFNYTSELLVLYLNKVKGYKRVRNRRPKVLVDNKMPGL